jgi:hypoxanthine phosphoribosyltransferase
MSGFPFDSSADPRVRPHEFLELDWEMFGELCRALAMRVSRDFRPEVVVGVARAGVIPAAIIASLLRIPFHAISITRRDREDHVRDRPEIFSQVPQGLEGKRVLLVDEIATSGDTLRLGVAALRQAFPAEIRTAVTFARPRGYRPDYHALETDTTVVFPWDVKVFDGETWVVNPRYRDVLEAGE